MLRTKIIFLFFLIVVLKDGPVRAQVRTIITDGVSGIEHCHMVDDTVVIYTVPKRSPAWRIGIKPKDRILSVNGTKVSGAGYSLGEVYNLLYDRSGTTVNVEVFRKEENKSLEFDILREKSSTPRLWPVYRYMVDSTNRITINEILADTTDCLFTPLIVGKATVAEVDSSSPAYEAGLEPGDQLISLQEELNEHHFVIIDYNFLGGIPHDTQLVVLRDSNEVTLDLNPSEKHSLEGISSRIMKDLEEQTCWLEITTDNRINEDLPIVMKVDFYGDSLIVYEQNDYSGLIVRRAGLVLQRSSRDFTYKNWEAIRINLDAGKQQTFYVHMFSESGLDYVPYIQFIPLSTVLRYDRSERTVVSAFAGMMILICIYYLILYFTNRRKHFLYYSLFIIGFMAMLVYDMGLYGEFIWGRPLEILYRVSDILYGIPVLLFILFSMAYLDIGKEMKVWYNILRIDFIVILTTGLYGAIFLLVSEGETFGVVLGIPYLIFIVSAFLPGPVLLIIAIKKLLKRFPPAWYFMVALVVLIALIIIQLGGGNEFSESSAYHSNLSTIIRNSAVLMGAVTQFLIFSMGLARKMKLDEEEKKRAQERIIEQLKENEKLKDKVNRELEQKVNERTKEISDQKEEIEAQRDEIEAQRDQLEIQRDLVIAQKQEITDSINYAQRIQAAVLPHREHMDEALPDYFVLFRPRDIVSGDFFWIKEMGRFLMVVAADCTGHGVPGGFMSMLGISLLNEQVSRGRLDKPGEILDRLRIKVKRTLDQKGEPHEQKDGMDMAMALIDRERMVLQFAGAYNPLYLVRDKKKPGLTELSKYRGLENQHYRLTEIKGDRQPISIHEVETPFQTTELLLSNGDTIYLFSDGYVDQVGGPKRKKFLSGNLKKLLLEIQDRSMEEQKLHLEKSLEEWKAGYEQIDDILFMGIRV